MNNSVNPILVEVTRGDMVESFHRGAAAIVDANGQTIAEYGDIRRLIYPRSAIKPLQAMVLVESGAMEQYQLGNEQIALACASHSGEPRHVNAVKQWLAKISLDESTLECGSHASLHRETRNEMIRQGIHPSVLYNNCSGKHAGFITVAKHDNHPLKGYIKRSHPVQQRVLQTLEELTGESLEFQPSGLDGCGIPVVGISLHGIASAFAEMVSRRHCSDSRRIAAERVCSAMAQFPELVGGENRFCSVVPSLTQRNVLVKVGAEGVYAGMTTSPDCLGFALKIDDGSRRAAEVAMGWLISKFCNLESEILDQLKPWFQPLVKTVANTPAGTIRPAIR